ncbi:enkurin domain-containing protein 1-like isoform X1 [Danaus plexippus]|uniref:enkurin domain-containing protein 1-like isoform X1 n=1 Tax=Danaus plexippus TaxID=13037 RepID=UPI002AB0D22E|nr:enkurin domain-containing protein 1-like isoform X1 [Danaus plexippus]
MYTLKGIFPEPKKEQKKNFIKENMKQLKMIQGKSPKEPKFTLKTVHPPHLTSQAASSALGQVRSSPSNKSGKVTLNVGKTSSSNSRKKHNEIRIKKGDMAEFLKRKEMRQMKQQEEEYDDEVKSSESSSGRLRDIGCQTVESNLAQKLAESTKLTMLYPTKEDEGDVKKASGDSERHKSPGPIAHTPRRAGDDMLEEKNRSRLNSILDRKEKDPYLPSSYQKGVLPKYLRERKEVGKELDEAGIEEEHAVCPPGHVTLPDNERKETLRMLRNSFAELVSELNKMPVKTDTLRMRNRKMELEKQLAKLEEGIKVFSRPKVFVKIGE